MHQQVWVTPYRAGEMGIGRKGQAEMPIVVGRVKRLLHGAQQHGVDLLRVGAVVGGLGDGLKIARLRLLGQIVLHAHLPQVLAQHLQFFGRWPFVDTVQPDFFGVGNEFRRADIRSQHGFFNQTMGIIAHTGHDVLDAPQVVANDLGFGGIKIDSATALTRLQQHAVHVL